MKANENVIILVVTVSGWGSITIHKGNQICAYIQYIFDYFCTYVYIYDLIMMICDMCIHYVYTMLNLQLNIHVQHSKQSLGIFYLNNNSDVRKNMHVFIFEEGPNVFLEPFPVPMPAGRPSVARRRNR